MSMNAFVCQGMSVNAQKSLCIPEDVFELVRISGIYNGLFNFLIKNFIIDILNMNFSHQCSYFYTEQGFFLTVPQTEHEPF